MDPVNNNTTTGHTVQDTHNVHHQPEVLHRKGRDSAHSVDGHHLRHEEPHAATTTEPESGFRRVINKLNPLHRSPSPPATRTHEPAAAVGAGAPGGVVHDSHNVSDRPAGLSAVNPNVPGQDNRTLAEKAKDALHPGRHPEENNPKDHHRAGGVGAGVAGAHTGAAHTGVHPGAHTGAHTGATTGAATTGAALHRRRTSSSSPERPAGLSSTNPNVPGQDNRTVAEKAKDALHPARHPDVNNPKNHHHAGTGAAVGAGAVGTGAALHHRRTSSSSPERPAGLSTANPNVPGQDNRTFGEKAKDALHPGRHPNVNKPGDDHRTMGEKTHDSLNPRTHNNQHITGHDNRALGTGGAVAGGAATGAALHRRRSSSSSPERPAGLSSTNPNVPGQDNRTFGEKAKDALHPGRHPEVNKPGPDNRTLGQETKDSVDPRTRNQHVAGHDNRALGTGGALAGGAATGAALHRRRSSSSSRERPAGLSSTNPNVPGQDNRTFGEKAKDALHPGRHPEVNKPGPDNRTLGQETKDSVDPRRHQAHGTTAHELDSGARHHISNDGRTHNKKEYIPATAAAAGLGAAGYKHHEHNKHDLQGNQYGTEYGTDTIGRTDHGHNLTSTHDDRSVADKIKDKVDPRVKSDRREAQVIPTTTNQHSANRDVGGLEHSLRETRLDNDNPTHIRDGQSLPYAADSTDTFGRPHQPQTGLTSHTDTTSPAAGGLHVRDANQATANPGESYHPNPNSENYQPGYSIPPAERTGENAFGTGEGKGLNTTEGGLPSSAARQHDEVPPVHATGFRSEGGDFDAARPGAASEGRRLMDQVDKTGTSLDSQLR